MTILVSDYREEELEEEKDLEKGYEQRGVGWVLDNVEE